MKINKNCIVEQVVENICDNCKSCRTICTDGDTGIQYKVESRYCLDGSGYVDITIYSLEGKYVDTCKLKHPGDACISPFPNMELNQEPDCDCEDENSH